MLKRYMLVVISAFITAVVSASAPAQEVKLHSSDLSQPLTVAFIGDQGSGDSARALLQLIKAERQCPSRFAVDQG